MILKTPVVPARFLLVVPDRDLEIKTSPALPLTRQDEKTRTLARGAIPGGGAGEVCFSWTPRRADPALRGKANREKPRLSTRMYDLVTVSETEVHCQVRLDMEILRNEVDRFTLRLPLGVEIEEVACANLAGWSESIQAGHKDLLIRLAAPVSGNHTLNLVLVQPLEKADSTWKLPALEVVGAETVTVPSAWERREVSKSSRASWRSPGDRRLGVAPEIRDLASSHCCGPTNSNASPGRSN